MMRLTVFILFIVLPLLVDAQGWLTDYTRHALDNWPTHALMFTAGLSNGVSDAIQHKYDQTVFANWNNDQYWNPDLSYRNKYRSWPDDRRAAFPGAKTWLVWTTDAWHLTKTIQLKSVQAAIVTYRRGGEERKWWWPLADIGISSILFSVGFHTSQNIVIR